ncbi:hypothetical protein VNO80_23022 [Phaseolus coccineus]|uniref:Uncharacterized protein n=1 Tax=Phaseolus coccineus TaxID=3886 RepID=A0AAN9M690_PHACN
MLLLHPIADKGVGGDENEDILKGIDGDGNRPLVELKCFVSAILAPNTVLAPNSVRILAPSLAFLRQRRLDCKDPLNKDELRARRSSTVARRFEGIICDEVRQRQ